MSTDERHVPLSRNRWGALDPSSGGGLPCAHQRKGADIRMLFLHSVSTTGWLGKRLTDAKIAIVKEKEVGVQVQWAIIDDLESV